jgi:opacity protein-like surface antigen
MRKFVILFISLVLSSSVAYAAPAYGTKMPQKGKFFGGLQYYAILDRDLNNDNGDLRSSQEHILLSYGVTDWLSLDLKASMGTIEHEAADGTKIKYDRPLWGGGYGFRVRLYENGPVKVVSGFQHISIHPRTVKRNGEKNNAILDDWQGSALVSYDLKKFTPYTGLRYGATDYLHRLNNDANRVYIDEDRRFDAVLGVDVPLSEKVWLNVEGAFGGGEALATSVNFKF